jgi:hypothetical protein
MKEFLNIRGDIELTLIDSITGEIKFKLQKKNLIVNTGKAFIISRMKDTTSGAMTHIGIGSGTVDPALGDTSLGNQVARNAMTTSGGVVSGNSITYSVTFGAGVGTNAALSEAGIFNAATGGTMLSRVEFSPVGKGASDILTIDWTISCP